MALNCELKILSFERYKPYLSFMIGVFVWGNTEKSFLGFINEGNTKYIDILFFRFRIPKKECKHLFDMLEIMDLKKDPKCNLCGENFTKCKIISNK